MKKASIIIVLSLVPLLLYSCQKSNMPPPSSNEITAVVKAGAIEDLIFETGTIEPCKKVEIKSKTGGEIVRINVAVGQMVKKGEVLARIDARQINNEKEKDVSDAEYKNIETNSVYINNRKRLEKYRKLFSEGIISAQEFDDIQKEHDVTQSQFESSYVRSRLIKKGYGERLQDYLVISPINGVVIEKNAEQGEIISAGTVGSKEGSVIMSIADRGRLLVRSKINETNVNKIRIGQIAKISADAAPGRIYTAVITKVANVGKSENNIVTFEVQADIEESDSSLRPGMTAKLDILSARREKVLLVPVNAVFTEGGKSFVDVKGQSGFVKREVKTGISDRINVEILSGLKQGESVRIP